MNHQPPPCAGNALFYDAVLDHHVGSREWHAAVTACRAICATCPLATRLGCLKRNYDHPSVIAGLTIEQRLAPASHHPTCGTSWGRIVHRRNNEQTCADCRTADAAKARRDKARRKACA